MRSNQGRSAIPTPTKTLRQRPRGVHRERCGWILEGEEADWYRRRRLHPSGRWEWLFHLRACRAKPIPLLNHVQAGDRNADTVVSASSAGMPDHATTERDLSVQEI